MPDGSSCRGRQVPYGSIDAPPCSLLIYLEEGRGNWRHLLGRRSGEVSGHMECSGHHSQARSSHPPWWRTGAGEDKRTEGALPTQLTTQPGDLGASLGLPLFDFAMGHATEPSGTHSWPIKWCRGLSKTRVVLLHKVRSIKLNQQGLTSHLQQVPERPQRPRRPHNSSAR